MTILVTLGELLRSKAFDPVFADRPFLLLEDEAHTFRQTWEQAVFYAHAFLDLRRHAEVPLHVGILMENRPEFVFALLGCALSGGVLVGLNTTHRGQELAAEIRHCDCQILLTERKFLDEVRAIRGGLPLVAEDRILVCTRRDPDPVLPPEIRSLEGVLEALGREKGDAVAEPPSVAVRPEDWISIVFTSGSTGAPKAIPVSHAKAVRAATSHSVLSLTDRDVFYAAMPLFHSNSLGLAFLPALALGAKLAMARRFSASRFLDDVRRYGVTVFNYVGKPLAYILATPEKAGDAENSLRAVIGNGATARQQEEFRRRFGLDMVIEQFGSTEGGTVTARRPGDPIGSVGAMPPYLKILNHRGEECPQAVVDAAGNILNYEGAVGEIVNTGGAGEFEGYYKNPGATAQKIRDGMFHFGDLAYYRSFEKDGNPTRYMYFVGRTDDWIRKDGENFLAEPIEDVILRHDDVVLASVYGVPCAEGDEHVMAAIVLRDAARFDPGAFFAFLTAQPDMSPKWLPDYVLVSASLSQTHTPKVQRPVLKRDGFDPSRVRDPIYWRERGETGYKPYRVQDHARVRAAFTRAGRELQRP